MAGTYPYISAFTAAQNVTNASSVVVTLASGAQNDLMMIMGEFEADVSLTLSGWTAVTGSPWKNSTTESIFAFYKVRGASESNPTLQFGVSGYGRVLALNVKGWDFSVTGPTFTVGTAATGSTTSGSLGSLLCSSQGSLRFGLFGSSLSTLASAINSIGLFTMDNTANGSRNALYAGFCPLQANGNTGTRTMTTGNGAWVGVQFLLAPTVTTTFGIARCANAGTRGTGNTSITATLKGDQLNANITQSLITVHCNLYYTPGDLTTVTVGGVTIWTNGDANGVSASYTAATDRQWTVWKENQSSTAGSDKAVVVNRTGSDSMEAVVIEWVGSAITGVLDTSGTNNAALANSGTVSTSQATTAGNRLAIGTISPDTNPGAATASGTGYADIYRQTNGTTGWYGISCVAHEFSGGSTETCTWALAQQSDYAATIVVFEEFVPATLYPPWPSNQPQSPSYRM